MAELTGKAVSELPEATNVQNSDLLAISQNATSKKVTVETLLESNNTYSSTVVSKASGIATGTLDNNNCYKVGNIVVASGRIHTMTNQDAGTHVFFKIPEGFRPHAQLRVMGYMNIDNIGSVSVFATINTNGDVSLVYSSSYQCNQVGFAGSFPI